MSQSAAERLLSKSTKGVTFLLFGSFFTKFATFILNQILITYISAKIFGINAFLEFLMNTVLFFSREGIRLSSQRIHDDSPDDDNDDQLQQHHQQQEQQQIEQLQQIEEKKDDDNVNTNNDIDIHIDDKYNHHNRIYHGSKIYILQSLINLAYIPTFIGLPLATIVMYWQYGKISDLFKNMELFNTSLLIIWFAIIFELFVEPFYIINQFQLNYDKRTSFETTAITLSCIVNFIIVVYFKDKVQIDGLPILAFSISKLVHSLTLLILYYIDFRTFKSKLINGNKLSLKLTKLYNLQHPISTNIHYFDTDALTHFYKIFFNLSIKHLLSEGDKLVISSLYSIEEQGIYSLISNYGSLLARLIFSPIEESLRNFLTRLLSNNSKNENLKSSTKNLQLSLDILQKIIKFYIYLSLIIVIFGPLNSGYLIQKIIGNNWSNQVSDSMPLYTLYLPLLAFNGILEAVHQSTASGNEVVQYTYYMVIFSVAFLITTLITTSKFNLAINGLIFLNMINMILRIFYCSSFIKRYYSKNLISFKLFNFNDNQLKQILGISLIIWILDLLIFGITRNFLELVGNIILALGLLITIIYKEKELIFQIVQKKPLVGLEKN
ncbi:hypothetical protein WICMUC_003887 [Wickerhamomyces mucosus]|uniref:Man(5)GlcNAc(2)-PP-dolichol translocation protein RFT1 n=1 Tax=Wickerhamomyces mucosus TaxID=1378264 RepID=A0A9P8TBW6_9ASCO|nr:hypothetical protein WICMUC_003887 [Wickerhamomyces mucosus]